MFWEIKCSTYLGLQLSLLGENIAFFWVIQGHWSSISLDSLSWLVCLEQTYTTLLYLAHFTICLFTAQWHFAVSEMKKQGCCQAWLGTFWKLSLPISTEKDESPSGGEDQGVFQLVFCPVLMGNAVSPSSPEKGKWSSWRWWRNPLFCQAGLGWLQKFGFGGYLTCLVLPHLYQVKSSLVWIVNSRDISYPYSNTTF